MILVVDNYDSFTYNLVQLLAVAGAVPLVVRNDAATADDLLTRGAAGIVLSPGPGRPEGAGICLDLLARRPHVPILGVCLGHQAIGVSFGAVVTRAAAPVHGKTSRVWHRGQALFAGIPDPFEATRYHSLIIERDALPQELDVVAWSDDDLVMALRHRDLPYWGVQFHPESVLTEAGPRLLENFLSLCAQGSGKAA